MSTPAKLHQELRSFFDQQEFVEATIRQINKDLDGLYYGTFELNEQNNLSVLENLSASLAPILSELAKRLPEQLSQFMYRVDLGETKFFDSLQADNSLHKLASQVIEREAQKVYLRIKFSQK